MGWDYEIGYETALLLQDSTLVCLYVLPPMDHLSLTSQTHQQIVVSIESESALASCSYLSVCHACEAPESCWSSHCIVGIVDGGKCAIFIGSDRYDNHGRRGNRERRLSCALHKPTNRRWGGRATPFIGLGVHSTNITQTVCRLSVCVVKFYVFQRHTVIIPKSYTDVSKA